MGATICMANERGYIQNEANERLQMDLAYGNFESFWEAMGLNHKSVRGDTTGQIPVDQLEAVVRWFVKDLVRMRPYNDYVSRLLMLINAAKSEGAPFIQWG